MNDIAKRIKRSGGHQDTKGRCVICGGSFQNCKHSMQEVKETILAYRLRSK